MDRPGSVSEPFDAIVLAGGGARRLGGVDKPALDVGGMSLLDRVLAACAGAESVAVVGPAREVRFPVVFTREDPPGGGPVPALAAGMAVGSADLVAVFAADLPFLDRPAVEALRRALAAEPAADAVLFTDAHGKEQPLAAIYRRSALAEALAALPELSNARLFSLLRTLRAARIGDPRGVTADCDTWDAVHAARALLATPPPAAAKMDGMDHDKLLVDWCAAAAAELGLAGHELTAADLDAILGLAGVAAHNVVRPAAPLTTFLAGYAIGLRSSADGGRGALDGPIAKLSALAQAWGGEAGEDGGTAAPGAGTPVPADPAPARGSVAEHAAGSGPARVAAPGPAATEVTSPAESAERTEPAEHAEPGGASGSADR
jgi:molybdopterin-guanine dinucleotide biosynthesis protein A